MFVKVNIVSNLVTSERYLNHACGLLTLSIPSPHRQYVSTVTIQRNPEKSCGIKVFGIRAHFAEEYYWMQPATPIRFEA